MATDYEEALEAVGGFGRYQLWAYIWLALTLMVVAGNNGFMTFGKLLPPDNLSLRNGTNFSTSSIQFYSVAMEYDLAGSRSYITTMMFSVQMIGMLIGSIVFTQICDRFGRRPSFLFSFISLALCGIVSAFCPNWQSFMALRLIAGLAIGGATCTSYVWIMEILLPKHRLLVQVGAWPLGYMFGAAVAKLAHHWSATLLWLQAPALPALLMVIPLLESPKWLHERGELVKSGAILQKIAKYNGLGSDEATESVVLDYIHGRKEHKRTLTFWHLFYNRRATLTMIVLNVMWFQTGVLSYGISLNFGDLAGDVALNVIYVHIARAITQVLLVVADIKLPWLTRRLTFLSSSIIATVCFLYNILAYSTSIQHLAPWSLTVVTMIAISAIGLQWCMDSTCAIELSPTLLRTMAYGFLTVISRFGAILGPQVFLLFAIFKPAPYIILAVFSVGCFLIVYFLLPETKGSPLPDFPSDFERKVSIMERSELQKEELRNL